MGRRASWLGVACALTPLALAACGSSGGTPTLTFYIFNEPAGSFTHAAQVCSDASGGRYTIQIALLPAAADGQRQQLVRRLAAKDASIDILGMDVVWAPEFAEAGWIKEWTGRFKDEVSRGTLPTALQTASWQGRLYAAPDNSNTQLLWYRKDLVPNPPKTWDEMIQMGTQLQQQGRPGRIEIQGAQYEGLTVWFNSMVNSAGGHILKNPTTVDLGAAAEAAAATMKRLASSSAADPSLSNQMEDDNRLAFETGKAAFELNYPFVYPSAKTNAPAIYKNMGYAQYPAVKAGQIGRSTIGGIDLGVGAYSTHPDLAFEAASCLRRPDNEIFAAIKGGLPPTIESLYKDPGLRKEYPEADAILTSLQNDSVRPQSPAYTNISLEIQSALSPPSSIDPSGLVKSLSSSITDAINSKGLVP